MTIKNDTEISKEPKIGLFVSKDRLLEVSKQLLSMHIKEKNKKDPPNEYRIMLKDKQKILCQLLWDSEDSIHFARMKPLTSIIIDNRCDDLEKGVGSTLAGRILPSLLAGENKRLNIRNSILVLLPEHPDTPYHAYALGSLHIGGVLVKPTSYLQAFENAYKIFKPQTPGKVALCLAGGGIEGMLWEIGVLRALDSCLENKSIIDFDIFSGISAGAVLCAFMANKIRPFEIANALYGRPSRIDPITRAILFNPNIKEFAMRLFLSMGDFFKGRWLTRPFDSAMRITPTAMFSGEKLASYLEREFNKKDMTNFFNSLDSKLFIGATDQDEGTHVSFGTPGYDHVSISTAVRASTAMTPYYSAAKIENKYYVDGIFTRTIDLDIAVANGATLIICVDPLRPVQTSETGYVSGKGGLFSTVQTVKAMIRSRLSEMITKSEELNPNVSVYVFSPTAKNMEQMSGTMMRFFYKVDTEQMAYESSMEQIQQDYESLSQDLQRHGYSLKSPKL